MKKIISLAAMVGICFSAYAGEYKYLTFMRTDGTEVSLSVNQLEFTFEDGILKAKNQDGEQAFPISQLGKMFFSVEPTAILGITSDSEVGEVELFSPEGIRIGRFPSANEALSSTKKGLYILKSKSTTVKIVKP